MLDEFLALGVRFLNFKRCALPFKYPGLSVGDNFRRASTWDHMIQLIRGRLQSWQHRSLNLGGRIVLVKLVLSRIPIFYLSFMKMPVKARK